MPGRRLLAITAIAVIASLTALALAHAPAPQQASHRVDPEENEATHLTAHGLCGIERWPVKTLTDPAARSVNLVAGRATVAGMNALPGPTLPADNNARLRSERQAFRVTATLVQYKLEKQLSSCARQLVETGEFQSRVRMIAKPLEIHESLDARHLQRLVRGYRAPAWWLERLRTA